MAHDLDPTRGAARGPELRDALAGGPGGSSSPATGMWARPLTGELHLTRGGSPNGPDTAASPRAGAGTPSGTLPRGITVTPSLQPSPLPPPPQAAATGSSATPGRPGEPPAEGPDGGWHTQETQVVRTDRGRRGGAAGPAGGRLTGTKITDGAPRAARPSGGRRYLPPERVAEPEPVASAEDVPPGTGAMPWLDEQPPPGPATNGRGFDEPVTLGSSAASALQSGVLSTGGLQDGYGGAPGPLGGDLGDPGDVDPEGPGPSLVRPYSRTGGRTRPGRELDLEALVVTTINGREAWSSPLLTPEHTQVIGMCVDTTSVAEIAARLAVPVGVARVIIADMVDLGLVEVMKTSANLGDERDPAFLRRVLSGLQRL